MYGIPGHGNGEVDMLVELQRFQSEEWQQLEKLFTAPEILLNN